MTIVRYEPWAFVGRLQRQLDRALGEVADGATISWIPQVDVYEEADRFVVTADLPGVEGKDIEVTADKGVLTIKGERRSEKKSSKDGFESLERRSGTFLRRFTLPESVEIESTHWRQSRLRPSGGAETRECPPGQKVITPGSSKPGIKPPKQRSRCVPVWAGCAEPVLVLGTIYWGCQD